MLLSQTLKVKTYSHYIFNSSCLSLQLSHTFSEILHQQSNTAPPKEFTCQYKSQLKAECLSHSNYIHLLALCATVSASSPPYLSVSHSTKERKHWKKLAHSKTSEFLPLPSLPPKRQMESIEKLPVLPVFLLFAQKQLGYWSTGLCFFHSISKPAEKIILWVFSVFSILQHHSQLNHICNKST